MEIDLYGHLGGILDLATREEKSLKNLNVLPGRICLSGAVDKQLTHGAEAHIDKIGSGGWLPTLSKLLVNALDIASKPPHISALLSSLEGAHASQGAEYNGESPILTSGGA